ncbi:MAG: hypothetical protein JWR05_3397 [Mucilaginibacter sp.]|nr:hypothetical protein [Mucilaginibacter sp.]
MKKFCVILLLSFTIIAVKAQVKINNTLKHELDSMYVLDQKNRELVSIKLDSNKVDSLTKLYHINKGNLRNYLMKLQTDADSSNTKRVEEIIRQYGYPGKSVVGEPTNEAVFYIIQHSTKIDKYLPLVEQAANKKELPFRLYAMMKDRSLMHNKKEQIWDSQAWGMNVINKQTGKNELTFFIWPIMNAKNVNKRRKEAGFDQTVEENAKRLGLTYKVYTMEQVDKGLID